MKKAIYLRKSRGVIQDLDKHKRQLLKLCNDNKWSYDLYEEIASSEKFEERKELTCLLDNINKYDAVVCIHMDRLSRNELHQALITQIFREHDVKVITLNKTYDFNKENDILLGDFEKLIARQELRLTKNRLRRGKISAFEKGLWVNGFPPIPYVYNRETKTLDIDDNLLEEFNRIKNMALDGVSCNVIADTVGTNATRIKRLLKSKVPLGYTKYKNEYREGKHKAVITKAEYEKINNFITGRRRGIRRTKHHYPFTDLIKCTCGHKRTAVKFKDKEAIFSCKYCGDCGTVSVKFHKVIRKEIKKYIKEIEREFNSKENNIKKDELFKELNLINSDIVRENKKLENIKKMMINDLLNFDEGTEELSKVKKNINYIEQRKTLIESDLKHRDIDIKEEFITLKMAVEVLNGSLEDSEINILYKKIIDNIVIKDKKIIKIVWK